MINYLQTSKNEKLKDIRKINEFKGKNIKFSIVKKSSTIYKDELPEINLPKPDTVSYTHLDVYKRQALDSLYIRFFFNNTTHSSKSEGRFFL